MRQAKKDLSLLTDIGQTPDQFRILFNSCKLKDEDRYHIERLAGHAGLGEPKWEKVAWELENDVISKVITALCAEIERRDKIIGSFTQ